MNHTFPFTLTILGLALLTACSSVQSAGDSTPAAPASLTRISDEASVVVDVTPLNLEASQDNLILLVNMNTHSVDLTYDLSQMAVLRTSSGIEVPALAWDGPTSGGHHVSGLLTFQAVDLTGVAWIEVVVTGVADVPERSFRWDAINFQQAQS